MAIYEYKCPDCLIVYECLDLRNRDYLKKPCPKCGKLNKKIMSETNVHLKDGGVGWHKDGYNRQHSEAEGPSGKSGKISVPVRNSKYSIEPNKDNSKKKKPKLKIKK